MPPAFPPDSDDNALRAVRRRAPHARHGNRVGDPSAARLRDGWGFARLADADAFHHAGRLYLHGSTERLDGTPPPRRPTRGRRPCSLAEVVGRAGPEIRMTGQRHPMTAKPNLAKGASRRLTCLQPPTHRVRPAAGPSQQTKPGLRNYDEAMKSRDRSAAGLGARHQLNVSAL